MGILAWIVVGLIAGWLAGLVVRGGGYGFVGNVLIGIVGALVGGFLASAVFGIRDPLNGIDFTTIIVAFAGSVLFVLLLRALRGSPTP